jgi:short-subunit dehydrogenase
MNNLDGKTVVITGAASGIGRELALQLSVKGCRLALIDFNSEKLKQLELDLATAQCASTFYVVDVSSREQVEELGSRMALEFQGIDILINNAGFTVFSTFMGHKVEDFQRMMAVNFFGAVYMCKYLIPLLRRRKASQIVNMSSILGTVAPPVQTSYASSKAAIRAFSTSLGEELREFDVSVSTILGGPVVTNINDAAICDPQFEKERKMYCDHVNRTAMSSKAAALAIIKGIEKRQTRIFFGFLDRLLDIVERVIPGLGTKLAVSEVARGVGGIRAFKELIRKADAK